MRFEQTLGNGKIKTIQKRKEYASPVLRQNSKRKRKRNSNLPTRQRNYTILAGQKINGNSIHKSRKRLDFETRRKEAAHELKSSRKQLSEGNKPGII